MVFKRFLGKRTLLLALMVGLMGALLVACGSDEESDSGDGEATTPTATEASGGGEATASATEAMQELSGSLNIEGSSTVAPYTRLAIDRVAVLLQERAAAGRLHRLAEGGRVLEREAVFAEAAATVHPHAGLRGGCTAMAFVYEHEVVPLEGVDGDRLLLRFLGELVDVDDRSSGP